MKVKYVRKNKTIFDREVNTQETYKSVNKAKKASADIQRKAGGLGCGILRKGQ